MQGVTKRCRLYLLTNNALVYEPKCGVSANEYSCAQGVHIIFRDLTPYLTYNYMRGIIPYHSLYSTNHTNYYLQTESL
jgi:hypothetical protein